MKVYAEHLLEPLLKTIHALAGPKTTIMVWNITFIHIFPLDIIAGLFIHTCYVKLGYEIRSTNVHEQMLEMWKKNFEVKTVSQSKVHYTSNVSWVSETAINLDVNPCLVLGNVGTTMVTRKCNLCYIFYCTICCRWTPSISIRAFNSTLWG